MENERTEANGCIRVFSGYDMRAPIGHHICEQSILEHSSLPVTFTPLFLSTLKSVFTRERSPTQLTDFTFSRFIVPLLCNYEGWSLFIDGNDMMMRADIAELWKLRDDRYAVMVVKHPEFKGEHTFMGNSMTLYSMFNWSSVMLFNNAKCRGLTQGIVNNAEHLYLHQFKWLESQDLVGELPPVWNHLVGYYPPRQDAKLVHWTLGAPYQGGDFAKTEHAEEWFALYKKITTLPRDNNLSNALNSDKAHNTNSQEKAQDTHHHAGESIENSVRM